MKNLTKSAFASILFTLILVLSGTNALEVTAATPLATSNPALSPTELWNFTAAYTTAHSTGLDWASSIVVNGIAYVWNIETYTIPGEPYLDLFNSPVQHTLGNIYALNASSGSKLWNFTAQGTIGSLDIVDGIIYVSANDYVTIDGLSLDGNIYALNAVTGAQKWSYNGDGQIRWSSINDGVIYACVQDSGNNCYIYAVKIATGEELWNWSAGYDVWLSNPAFGGGTIYFGTFDGEYYAINAVNGTVGWSVATGGAVRDFSCVVNGTVYLDSDHTSYPVNNTDNYIYVLNAQNGDKLWSCPVGFAGSSPIVDGGIVYIEGREANLTNPYTLSAQMEWEPVTFLL